MLSPKGAMQTAGEKVWILGGGRFGQQAVEVMLKKTSPEAITLVDTRMIQELSGDITFIQEDAVDWLVDHLSRGSGVGKIIPALPVHLVVEWLKGKISSSGAVVQSVDINDELLENFPNPYRTSPSQIVVSNADFICPPTCVEPEKLCTYTKQPRPTPLYHLLQEQSGRGFIPLIVRSRQFGSGVGGYYPEDIWVLYERVLALRNTPLLIGTACKCHGIVDGLIVK
ncbi:MAG: hypothetical protein ACN4GW_06655 [Desulforhopalus sp.]